MATSDYQALSELLELLRRFGVTHYVGPDGTQLVIGEAAPPREVPVQANEHKPEPRPVSPYDHPSLWPNGQKPAFK